MDRKLVLVEISTRRPVPRTAVLHNMLCTFSSIDLLRKYLLKCAKQDWIRLPIMVGLVRGWCAVLSAANMRSGERLLRATVCWWYG